MIIVLKPNATKDIADEIMEQISERGCKPLYMPGSERVVLGAIGDERILGELRLENHPQVERVTEILTPYKLVSREFHPHDSIVKVGSASVGGDAFTVIAGPCSIESEAQFRETATAVKASGAVCVRGGAYKPRSSPYSFQGLGLKGLEIMQSVCAELSLPGVTEVVEVEDVAKVEAHADAFQVGARNMQNFRLLKELGRAQKPVILKRGMAATVKDLLLAAEYIVSEGNNQVILCERGIRTFETATRNTLDLNAIPVIKQRSHLPVIVDPSHGTGVREFVTPMALAAAACGADGIIVEVHRNPREALSDGAQSLFPEQFSKLMKSLKGIVEVTGRRL